MPKYWHGGSRRPESEMFEHPSFPRWADTHLDTPVGQSAIPEGTRRYKYKVKGDSETIPTIGFIAICFRAAGAASIPTSKANKHCGASVERPVIALTGTRAVRHRYLAQQQRRTEV